MNDGWQKHYKDALAGLNPPITTFFAPDFSNSPISPTDKYNTFPVVDGLFNWESAWPAVSEGRVNVSSEVDQEYLAAARAAGKPYMMRPFSYTSFQSSLQIDFFAAMSNIQFKHLDSTQNWYRRGELNIAQRMAQVLAAQPNMLEFQTWNDGGESSYIGNVWDYAIEGSPAHGYIDGFSHAGWQNILAPFISAFKAGAADASAVVPLNGAAATGAFWYHPILTTATCASDSLGKPSGWNNAEDVVNVAVLLSVEAAGATVNVYSGGDIIGSVIGGRGLSSWSIAGLKTSTVKVEVIQRGGGSTLLSASGGMDVAADAAICNFNEYVVGL